MRTAFRILALLLCARASAQTVLDDFEKPSAWTVQCPDGGTGIRAGVSFRDGAPLDLRESGGKKVLGVRLEFLEPRAFRVDVLPPRPMALPGADGLSVWVHGSNMDHELWVRLSDRQGAPVASLFLGKLDFSGWKQLRLTIPDVLQGIPLSLAALSLRCDLLDLRRGVLYLYFDDLSMEDGGRTQ